MRWDRILSIFCVLGIVCSLASLGCEGPLSKARTRSGLTPSELFSAPQAAGRPRFLLTVGLPGSGKSFWVEEARRRGWVVVNADELRVERLRKMQSRHELIDLGNGKKELADPKNAAHVFSWTLRDWAYEEADRLLLEAQKRGVNIVWDGTNLDQVRLPKIYQARAQGYFVEALAFISPDLDVNVRNIGLRARRGGLDLQHRGNSSPGVRPEVVRRQILEELQGCANAFSIEGARVRPNFFSNRGPLPSLTGTPKEVLRQYDILNRLEFVDVVDTSAIP